ncbi:MAG: hypothetical protein AAFO75_08910 [Pseudomonadota bacterium]
MPTFAQNAASVKVGSPGTLVALVTSGRFEKERRLLRGAGTVKTRTKGTFAATAPMSALL